MNLAQEQRDPYTMGSPGETLVEPEMVANHQRNPQRMKPLEIGKESSPDQRTLQPTQFSIRYLLFASSVSSLGLFLTANADHDASVRILGIGICSYWLAKGTFAYSTRLAAPWKEGLFLAALPIYLLCVFCLGWGAFASFASFFTG